ncbi:hypothetical protein FCV25MIE_12237 [Fagus crenata]
MEERNGCIFKWIVLDMVPSGGDGYGFGGYGSTFGGELQLPGHGTCGGGGHSGSSGTGEVGGGGGEGGGGHSTSGGGGGGGDATGHGFSQALHIVHAIWSLDTVVVVVLVDVVQERVECKMRKKVNSEGSISYCGGLKSLC